MNPFVCMCVCPQMSIRRQIDNDLLICGVALTSDLNMNWTWFQRSTCCWPSLTETFVLLIRFQLNRGDHHQLIFFLKLKRKREWGSERKRNRSHWFGSIYDVPVRGSIFDRSWRRFVALEWLDIEVQSADFLRHRSKWVQEEIAVVQCRVAFHLEQCFSEDEYSYTRSLSLDRKESTRARERGEEEEKKTSRLSALSPSLLSRLYMHGGRQETMSCLFPSDSFFRETCSH